MGKSLKLDDIESTVKNSIKSYVGMVIYSTTLDTQAKVKAVYGGTTWIKLSGYMLRAASSGVTANQNANDGGADSVTVSSVASHNHTQNAHTHTQDSHNHTQNAHTHTQNAHTHTQNAHNHSQNAHKHNHNANYSANNTHRHYNQNSYAAEGVESPSGSGTYYNTIHDATATNNAATATNQNTTATNKATGANYSVATLPKYKNVYVWERTA